MLWSCNDGLRCVSVFDLKDPCLTPLTDNRSGLTMEPSVRHPFVDTWFHNNVNLLPLVKLLNDRGHRWETTCSECFLELISRLLPWTVM